MITKPKLECKYPVGNGVSAPQYKDGQTTIIPGGMKKVSISDGAGDTSTGPNKSAQFKYPRVSQDVPAAGKNQYM